MCFLQPSDSPCPRVPALWDALPSPEKEIARSLMRIVGACRRAMNAQLRIVL
jgi:hypothetical protein